MNVGENNVVNGVLWVWFTLTFLSVAYVTCDLIVRTPEMKVMKWGWILVTLYTGPVAFIVYWLSCREPAPGTHEKFIAPLWKQTVGSAIHCMAGDATGIIVAAAITSLLGLPMGIDAAIEYAAGFAFGLLIFQALFMKDMLGGGYWHAVKSTWLPEFLSMNAVMAGMIPVMIILMTRDMTAMEPTSPRFWGIMSVASLVGAVFAYPINWWLVKNGLKHGMGTDRALGKGGAKISHPAEHMRSTALPTTAAARDPMPGGGSMTSSAMPGMEMAKGKRVPTARKVAVTLLSLVMLAGGFALAARYGDLSMRAGDAPSMPMP